MEEAVIAEAGASLDEAVSRHIVQDVIESTNDRIRSYGIVRRRATLQRQRLEAIRRDAALGA